MRMEYDIESRGPKGGLDPAWCRRVVEKALRLGLLRPADPRSRVRNGDYNAKGKMGKRMESQTAVGLELPDF